MSVPPHRCQLGDYNPNCHTMQEVYDKATHAPAKVSSMEQVMKPDSAHPLPQAPLAGPLSNNGAAYAEPGSVGQPLFKEPKVHRVWIAPYVDADGNLRSGEYTYFSTPGEWDYGSLRTNGAASGGTLFAPTKGTQLGFTPATKPTAAAPTPPKPETNARPNTQSLLPAITQPDQKLSD